MSRLRRALATHGLDAVIVALAVAGAISTLSSQDPGRPDGLRLAFEAVAVTVMILTLLLRRQAPFVAPATTWLLSMLLSFLDGRLIVAQGPNSIAGMIAAVLLGNLRNRRQAWVGLVIIVATSVVLVRNDPGHTSSDYFFIPVLFVLGWLIGFALNERAMETHQAEQRAVEAVRDREVAARIAVAEERARIARELHDVVAHAVSVMVLQVGAVRHRMGTSSPEDAEALRNVEHAGRTALVEMRRLLEAMRRDGEEPHLQPQPGLRAVDALVDSLAVAGLDVRVHVLGTPVDLPPALDLSAYRILQEALTNVLKHADARHAEVTLEFAPDLLTIEVRDDGHGPAPSDRHGHGLVGIGERVKIYGGDMSAEGGENGGFVLRARLPLEDRAR